MERKYRPPNLKLQEKPQGFDLPPKIMKTGAAFGGHKGKHSKDYKEWKAVSHSVSILFNGKKLTTHEFEKIYAIVSSWTNAEIESGDPVFELCQESILKRGMIILREDIKEKHGKTLLNKLADVWVRFYGNLLPMLQIIFHMMTSRGLNIRLLTLQNFRDVVLLKTEAKEAISAYPHDVPSPVRQMLLVLLSVHDSPHPSENYLKLEQMASKVIVPLLGARNLYHIDNVKPEGKSSKEQQERPDTLSIKSASSSGSSDSPLFGVARKLFRPFSMVEPSPSERDPDLDDLIQFRQQQRFRYSVGGRLSAVDEGQQSLASSFGSLVDD